jgi:hypothetical protein
MRVVYRFTPPFSVRAREPRAAPSMRVARNLCHFFVRSSIGVVAGDATIQMDMPGRHTTDSDTQPSREPLYWMTHFCWHDMEAAKCRAPSQPAEEPRGRVCGCMGVDGG